MRKSIANFRRFNECVILFLHILLLFMICVWAWSDMEINKTNYPDAYFRTAGNGFDTDEKAMLSEDEIGNVTELFQAPGLNPVSWKERRIEVGINAYK